MSELESEVRALADVVSPIDSDRVKALAHEIGELEQCYRDLQQRLKQEHELRIKAEAVNEDIIMASAIALIEGMNKALNFKRKKQKKRIHAQY